MSDKCPKCGAKPFPSRWAGLGGRRKEWLCGTYLDGACWHISKECWRAQADDLRRQLAQRDEQLAELRPKAREWDALQRDIEAANLPDTDEMVQSIIKEPKRQEAALARVPQLEGEIAALKAVITEVFSVDRSMTKEGCDIIGSSIAPWSRECRLTVINTLREAAEAAKAEKGEGGD